MKVLYSNNIVLIGEVIKGYLVVEKNIIKEIKQEYDGEFEDFSDYIILPGFIDQHVHGWGRGSLLYENDANTIRKMIEDQAKEGVTGFLVTTFTDSLKNIKQSIDAANEVYSNQNKGSKLLGMHIEGPFINPEYNGAQLREYCLEPSVDVMKELVEQCDNPNLIKLVTIAPELNNAKSLIEYCRDNNIQVSAGHTGATFEELLESKKWGVGGVTHMFSAMTGLHHRKPGVAGGALFDNDLMCEFAKQTGITVRHEVFDITYRLKGSDRIIMTTDCLGHAMQKEPYYHARRDVWFIPEEGYLIEKHGNGKEIKYDLTKYEEVRKIELSFIDSIKKMRETTKMELIDLAKITSTNSAKYIHIFDRKGSIESGKDADLTIVTPELNIVATMVEGDFVYDNRK